MKIKSYFAQTVEDAMAEARREMGPDAMLVNSRKAPPEARDLGEYEVVFAADAISGASGAPAAAGQPSLAAHSPGDRLSLEVAELKRELEGMRRALTRSAFAPPQWTAHSPALSEAYSLLTANEVDPELARDIVQGAAARAAGDAAPLTRAIRRPDPAIFERSLTEEIESRVATEPLLGRGAARPQIVALVGPPGSGKTTTLVKLAVNYGLAGRRPALLLSVDTYRVAAAEQLRSYAAILGIGFQVLDTVAALSQAIEENRGKDVIFIDTPGFGCGEMEQSYSLARFLASRNDIDSQLVLPSSMKPADLTRVVDLYRSFRPQRLLFTKLDETSCFGPILNEAARTGRPLSFFSAGQRIPEDMETASRERVAELVLTGRTARAQSAA